MWPNGNSCSGPEDKGDEVLLKKKGQIQRFIAKKKREKKKVRWRKQLGV